MNKAIKKFKSIFGQNLTKGFLFAIKENKNIDCDFEVTLKINNMQFKMDGLFFEFNDNIPDNFIGLIKNIEDNSDLIIDFDYFEERTRTIQYDDGVYAKANIAEESFMFSFKLKEKSTDKTAVLLGTINPFSYYETQGQSSRDIYKLTIELEVFDCLKDIQNRHINNKLTDKLIEKQDLQNFLINPQTKYKHR